MNEDKAKRIYQPSIGTHQMSNPYPVPFPVEPCCTSAVHLSCHQCPNKQKDIDYDKLVFSNLLDNLKPDK